MEDLAKQWRHLYTEHLPALAKAKDENQKHWPVYLDHCFARIILDNAVGVDTPWMDKIKSPAIKNMTKEQFEAAIKLAEGVASGSKDLDALNQRSLDLRGKNGPSKKRKSMADADVVAEKVQESSKKTKRSDNGNISSYFLPSPQSPKKPSIGSTTPSEDDEAIVKAEEATHVDMGVQLKRISDSNLTAFRKQTLSMLCEIPRGRYSTYQAMSDFISNNSHKTCARAVGNAMRNNPFAPEVPCHRILAADGTLGGFGGHWGENGKFAQEKHRLLSEEGVRFDSRGKVKGPPFRDFQTIT